MTYMMRRYMIQLSNLKVKERIDSIVYISDEIGNNIIEYINQQVERLTGEAYYIDGNGNIVFSMCYDEMVYINITMMHLVDGGQINHKSLINHKDLFYKNGYIGDLLNKDKYSRQ